MSRATYLLAGTTLLGAVTSLWLYFDNRSLRERIDDKPEVVAKVEKEVAGAAEPGRDVWLDANRPQATRTAATPPPQLPEQPKESRLDRRARRTDEFAARFGRLDGETEEEWRARVMPLVKLGLARARDRAAEARRIAEEKAKVTPEQSKQLDQAFEKVYSDVLDYTNKAIQDGQLSPYERNVAGWLDFAGGLGGILNDAEGQVGKILDPNQVKAMYDAGFEWGEYLGAYAPWEDISAPPPPPGG